MDTHPFGIEPQPNFPVEDLTYENAEKLALVLAKYKLVLHYYTEALKSSDLLTMGNIAVTRCVARLKYRPQEKAPISHGALLFNATHSIVDASPVAIPDHTKIDTNKRLLASEMGPSSLSAHRDIAYDALYNEAPNLAAMVAEASSRYYPDLTSYALLGTALSRQFEVDCM